MNQGKKILLEDNLGFFFSCFKEKQAVEFCIKNIRSFYPTNPIYLASDGGLNFDYLSNDNTKFKLYEDVLGYVNNPETKDKEKLIVCSLEFLSRIYEAANFCDAEYMMYFEPDVHIRKKISIQENLHINGSYANAIHSHVLNYIENKRPFNINNRFGSCGGSIMRTESLKSVVENTQEDLIRELIYLDPRISNCDYLLTVLFSLHGYFYSENTDFIEARRDTNWHNTDHAIVHQYHKNYSFEYEGKYI
jgi:hypothetical protein